MNTGTNTNTNTFSSSTCTIVCRPRIICTCRAIMMMLWMMIPSDSDAFITPSSSTAFTKYHIHSISNTYNEISGIKMRKTSSHTSNIQMSETDTTEEDIDDSTSTSNCNTSMYHPMFSNLNNPSSSSSTKTIKTTTTTYQPIFDFTNSSTNAIQNFDRIDDAIMGGISTSSLRQDPSASYATWSGVCRVDGGGFCGFRTLPFLESLHVPSSNDDGNNDGGNDKDLEDRSGLYVDCRLTSDDEPQRRIWKMTVRTEDGYRGEQVYQAEYELPSSKSSSITDDTTDINSDINTDINTDTSSSSSSWNRIKVPFNQFKLVRGPRLVPNGPPINVTNGIYQIGFTMSKFQMALNMTELNNFRAGFFELQLQQIGFYTENGDTTSSGSGSSSSSSSGGVTSTSTSTNSNVVKTAAVVQTKSKKEKDAERPLLLKLLFPILKVFFSEKASRRKVAMSKLMKQKNMNRWKAMKWGMKVRAGSKRSTFSIDSFPMKEFGTTIGILSIDSFRYLIFKSIKVLVFYPIKIIRRIVLGLKKGLGKNDGTKGDDVKAVVSLE